MPKIKAVVFDVDGTLTDGGIYMGQSGELFKRFDVKDGYAIHQMMPDNGLVPIVITGRQSDIVERRCKELGIEEVHQGVKDKLGKLKEIAKKLNIGMDEIAYIGDDVNDLKCMSSVGISACPSDAVADVIADVDYVCESKGGYGAVREFIQWLIENNQVY